jgi:hypothetical protein
MRVTISRHTKGLTPWGIFTNLTDRADRMTGADGMRLPFGLWYLDIHMPWVQVRLYATESN